MAYCENNSLDVFKYLPVTILMQYDSSKYLSQFERFSFLFNNIKDFIENPSTENTYSKSICKAKRYNSFFNFNFSSSNKIGSKSKLYIYPSYYTGKNLWLVKAVDLNRGRCIRIGDNITRIQNIIKKFYDGMAKEFKECEEEDKVIDISAKTYENTKDINVANSQDLNIANNNIINEEISKEAKSNSPKKMKRKSKYKSSIIIVQKYLENPLTYKKRKFDIRLWVLLTHKMDVYAFK